MSANILYFPYRYSDSDTASYILDTVNDLQIEWSRKRSLDEVLRELLAYKYGVQSLYELDQNSLDEYFDDAAKLKYDYRSGASPMSRFREMLACRYGVQSVYELDEEALQELLKDTVALFNTANTSRVIAFKKTNNNPPLAEKGFVDLSEVRDN